ncbi:hypothetical protein ACFQU7_14020 [Pseudoroseomonas wenyumeiae]
MLDQLHDWARKQAEQSGYRTVGIYAGAMGFGYNPELLGKRNIAAPPAGRICWMPASRARSRWPTRSPAAPPMS